MKGFTNAFKVKVLDEMAVEGAIMTKLSEKHGVSVNSMRTWQEREKEIRKMAARDAKDEPPALLNGKASNGEHKEQDTPGLKILGLTPLIRQLVKQELGPVIREELGAALQKELEARFSGKKQ